MKLNFKTLKNGQLITTIVIFMAALMNCGFTLKAQTPFDREAVLGATTNEQPMPDGIKDFIVQSYDHKVYIEFTVVGETQKSTLFLERSVDGTDYIVIAQKKAISTLVPSKEEYYSFIDQKPLNGITYYKIMQMKEDGIVYSEVLPIEYDNGTPPALYTENKAGQ